jgi:hypothetical protein
MNNITTTDLREFGYRERVMAENLLKAWRTQGLPENFYDDEVTIMFNTHSGCVFLTNSDYQAAMMNGNNLEIWHFCPYCGHEGFAEDMDHEPEDRECTLYLEEIGVINEDN